MNKIVIGSIAVVVIIAVTAWFSFNAGVNSCIAKQAEDRTEAIETDKEKVKEVIKYKTKIKVVTRDKIKYIKQVQDKTGCADVKLTDMGFGLQ